MSTDSHGVLFVARQASTESNHSYSLNKGCSLEMPSQQRSRWADLPAELVIIVMEILIEAACCKFWAAVNLRSTCKAWHAASRQYPAALACRREEDLNKLCKAFPRLASIDVGHSSWNIRDFQPLQACTDLTQISMRDRRSYIDIIMTPQQTDFSHLPESLINLALSNMMPTAGSISHLTNVTLLQCVPKDECEEQMSRLLQDLPQLQVELPFLKS